MDVKQFELEFHELLQRFSGTNSVIDKNCSPSAPALTNQEIIEAVQEVLNLKLNVNALGSLRGLATTPALGIVTTIPDAPDIPKLNHDHNGGIERRIRSFCSVWKERANPSIDDVFITEPSSALQVDENVNVIKIDKPGLRVNEKKVISKSTPDAASLIRSNTFVRENTFESIENGDVFNKNNFNSLRTNGGSSSEYSTQNITEILEKLSVLKDSLTDVVKKIDDIQVPNNTAPNRPIRRLSSIGCFPGLNRSSITGRPTQRPSMMRRSVLEAFPGTPTSSRLSPEKPSVKDSFVTGKTISNVPVTNTEGSKMVLPLSYRSASSGALTMAKKTLTRYETPARGSQAVNAPKKPSLRSPSMSSLDLKSRSAAQTSKSPVYGQDSMASKKRKAF